MAQAGRRWQRTIYPWLTEYGFVACHADPNVFTLEREVPASAAAGPGPKVERLILGCYVDDLCVLYSSDAAGSLYHTFSRDLQARWNVEDEGDVHVLLGIEFEFKDGTIT